MPDATDDDDELDIPLPDGVDADSPEAQEPTAEDIAQQIIDLESQQRLWLGVCLKVMQVQRHSNESSTVSRALDSVIVAAAARAKRILGSDPPLERP